MTPFRLATRYLGIGEIIGGSDHPLISWWLFHAGLPFGSHDEVPWCGAFVGDIFWTLGVKLPAFPARARHWMTVGTPVNLDKAEVGWDVVVMNRGIPHQPDASELDAPGHVGFFAGLNPDGVIVLGGNQSNKVSIATFPKERVLGVRRLGVGEV
jgi:uncharacterized protein (TIGR02594 family)